MELQSFLNDLKSYTYDHQMVINVDKTKVILFNNATKSDFFPNLTLDNEPLEVVVVFRSDLTSAGGRTLHLSARRVMRDCGCSGG